MNKEIASKIGNVFLVVLVIFISIILIESFLRIFKPIYFCTPLEGLEYDPEVGFRAKPGMHIYKLTDYQQEFKTNKLGTANFQEDFKNYEILVFAVGDSYTNGTGLYCDASYPSQLNLMLNIDQNGRYRNKYAVVNLGFPAIGGEQNFIILKRFMEKLNKPNIILYLGDEDDYIRDLIFKSGKMHKNIVENNPYYGWFYYPLKFIFIETEIGKYANYVIRNNIVKGWAENIERKDREKNLCVAELEREVIDHIIETAKISRSKIILSWAHYDSTSYPWLRSYAAEKRILFADWAPSLKSVNDAIPEMPIYNPHSGGHYRTWVNYLIAREFAQKIASLDKKEFVIRARENNKPLSNKAK
jgi:hypothetical protein